MTKYTVLLLYPDYLAEQYGDDTYLAWEYADSAETAIICAKASASEEHGEDFGVLAVFKGHLKDLSPC